MVTLLRLDSTDLEWQIQFDTTTRLPKNPDSLNQQKPPSKATLRFHAHCYIDNVSRDEKILRCPRGARCAEGVALWISHDTSKD